LKFYVGSIGGSASIKAIFYFLPHSSKNIRSDRCCSFSDSLFQVLNVVNMNTAEELLHVSLEIKIQGCQVRREWRPLLPPAPSQSSVVEMSNQEIP
jgi:hypothetical protein